MTGIIIKLNKGNEDYYLEWSKVVDAPVTRGMPLEQFIAYYRKEYGETGMDELKKRLERVSKKGTSSPLFNSVDELIANNRAGKNEEKLSKDEIIEKYCIKK